MPRKLTPTHIVGHRLKLQHLNVAMAIAQRGSMGKAAKQLAISQPVVSKVIADLEHLLGVRLFDRSPQGVVPTLYCRALLKRSVAIFDDVKDKHRGDPFPRRSHRGLTADWQH
jgi:DNA-binding transcriptional LysR family regulator